MIVDSHFVILYNSTDSEELVGGLEQEKIEREKECVCVELTMGCVCEHLRLKSVHKKINFSIILAMEDVCLCELLISR